MITLLIGLPGSGKTWYARNAMSYDYFIDDPMSLDDLPHSIADTKHMVIADPMLCVAFKKASDVLLCKYPGHPIELVFFEKNPEKCKRNIDYRTENGDNRKVNVTFDFLVKSYIIPNNVKTIPIWSPK